MATRAHEFEALYQGERARLARSAARIAGDRAEDIVHDAFLTFLTRREEVARPDAWLTRVARNRALNDLRGRREVALDRDLPDEARSTPAERDAVRSLVAAALGDLDPRSRLALRLRFFDEMPYEEIAEELGVRVAQAHVVLHRSLRRLGRALVRRLAEGHGASSCSPALERVVGLGTAEDAHDPQTCDRCGRVLDELAALRSLGLLPVAAAPLWSRLIGREAAARAPAALDVFAKTANTVVALGLAAVSVVAPVLPPTGIATTEHPQRRAPATRVADEPAGGPVRTAAREAPQAGTARAANEEPRTIADAGPVVVRGDERHIQGEVKSEEGAPAGGVVVCEPLQPCPPPPSPGP